MFFDQLVWLGAACCMEKIDIGEADTQPVFDGEKQSTRFADFMHTYIAWVN